MAVQRARPLILDNSRESIQKALNQAFDYIFQLQSTVANDLNDLVSATAKATPTVPFTIPFAEGDVPGAAVTLTLDGRYKIDAFVTMNGDNTTGKTSVLVNYHGQDLTEPIEALVTSAAGTFDGTYSAHWIVENVGTNIAKLRAKKAINAGTAQISAARITVQFAGIDVK